MNYRPYESYEAFLEDRRKGIGGSDVATIFGINPWQTRLELYLEKLGEYKPKDSPRARMGRILEPGLRLEYIKETGFNVTPPDEIDGPIINPKYPWLRANVDGLIETEKMILEIKTTKYRDGWGEPGTDEVPDIYLLQDMHYMISTGWDRVQHYTCFRLQDETQIYNVSYKKITAEKVIELTHDFWHNHVLKRIPPAPVTRKDAALMSSSDPLLHESEDQVVANDATLALIREINGAKKGAKIAKAHTDRLIDRLACSFNGKSIMVNNNEHVVATFKPDKNGKRTVRIKG